MPRAAAPADPHDANIVQEPSIGRVVHLYAGEYEGDVEAGTITRVFDQGNGTWLVNVRTTADGQVTRDRYLTSLTLRATQDDVHENEHACWWPARVG